MSAAAPRRLVVGVSGASGAPYALRLLQVLTSDPLASIVETHVIVSDGAREVLRYESGGPTATAVDTASGSTPPDPVTAFDAVLTKAARVYSQHEIAAAPASGSWRAVGMCVVPCSMASLSAIAHGFGANLLHRAADVTLKERRPLALLVRESPFNLVHLRNMTAAAEAGATIVPASPGFYNRPQTIADLIDHVVGRLLDLFGLDHALCKRWGE